MKYTRQFPRHFVQADKLQLAIRIPNVTPELKNISKGGLAFQYEPVKGRKLNINSISIVSKRPNNLVHLDIACRIVYDILSLEENLSYTGSDKRQCGVCFVNPTESQQRKLELILDFNGTFK